MKLYSGFTIIELIAVVLIIGLISVGVTSRLTPSSLFQLQAARELVISALFSAQQKAMSQQNAVQIITLGTDIDLEINGGSVSNSGIQYPLTLPGGVTLSSATISYDGLGHTTATSITLTKGGNTLAVTVTGTGYAY